MEKKTNPRSSKRLTSTIRSEGEPSRAAVASAAASGSRRPAVSASCAALRRYEETRIPRTTKLQTVSRARSHINHLPDGPEQRDRDAFYAQDDPLIANAWIYDYDPETILAEADQAR